MKYSLKFSPVRTVRYIHTQHTRMQIRHKQYIQDKTHTIYNLHTIHNTGYTIHTQHTIHTHTIHSLTRMQACTHARTQLRSESTHTQYTLHTINMHVHTHKYTQYTIQHTHYTLLLLRKRKTDHQHISQFAHYHIRSFLAAV